MRSRLVFIVVAVVAGYIIFHRLKPNVEPPTIPVQQPTTNTTSSSANPPPHPLSTALGASQTSLQQEPAIVLDLLNAWRRSTGRYPVAEDNAALIRQLTQSSGNRPPLLNPNHPRINPDGVLVDGWGTPYFFHHISANYMEVRSAGPDRLLYSEDDLVVPAPRLTDTSF